MRHSWLVMLVWGCCPESRRCIGAVGTVDGFGRPGNWYCEDCNRDVHDDAMAHSDFGFAPVSWLKKMPPDGERVEEREESEVAA